MRRRFPGCDPLRSVALYLLRSLFLLSGLLLQRERHSALACVIFSFESAFTMATLDDSNLVRVPLIFSFESAFTMATLDDSNLVRVPLDPSNGKIKQ